ncbi:MAG: hypothetical protein VX278_19305 [Myxococcota bacterium]|nr:hypothetical protein [Myxococcota bacterium]
MNHSVLKRFKTAVNALPLSEASFVPINALIDRAPTSEAISPILQYTPDAGLAQMALVCTPETIVAPMVQYFVDCGVAQNEMIHLERIARAINPSELGFFLRQEGNASSVGWTLLGPHSWDDLRGYLPPGNMRTKLQSWAAEQDIQNVLQYSRIVGPGVPLDEITVQIPDLNTALSLYEQEKMVLPPIPLLEEIEQSNPSKLALSIWISSRSELIRLAIRVDAPTLRLALASRLELPSLPDATHALIEGYLGVKAPSWVEIGLVAAGRDAQIGYRG